MNFIRNLQPLDYNDVFTKLQDYILTDQTMTKAVQVSPEASSNPKKTNTRARQETMPKPKDAIFEPREKDSLFWCFYIMKNGQTAYEMLDHRNFIVEKKHKINYVEKIRNDKEQIKLHKFATLTHLESNLANDDRIDLPTFLSLCVIENLNVTIVKKRTYFELLMNDGVETHTIHCLDNHKHGYNQTVPDKQTLLKIDNIVKPMKAISSYKVQDLLEFCEKLKIETINTDTNKTKSKNDLYESIVQYF
jgi:hypothetical protein